MGEYGVVAECTYAGGEIVGQEMRSLEQFGVGEKMTPKNGHHDAT